MRRMPRWIAWDGMSSALFLWAISGWGQQLGIGVANPHSSAVMEIVSQRGVLIPRLTTTQRNAIDSPAHGLAIYNVDKGCVEVYDSLSAWWRCSNYYTLPLAFCKGFSSVDSNYAPVSTEIRDAVGGSDGTVYVVGQVGSEGWVGAFDSLGRIQWITTVGDSSHQVSLEAVALDSMGRLVVVGTSQSPSDRDIVVVRVSGNGQVLWQRRLTADSVDAEGVAVAVDKHYRIVVLGNYNRPGGSGGLGGIVQGIVVIRMSLGGDTLWTRWLTGNYSGIIGVRGAAVDTAARIAAVGTFNSPSSGFVVVMDSLGDTLWTRVINDLWGGEPMAFEAATFDTLLNLYAGGWASIRGGHGVGVLIKFNAGGDTVWYRYFVDGIDDSFSYAITDLWETSDGHLLVAGVGSLLGKANLFLLKVNPDLQVVWGGYHGSIDSHSVARIAYCPVGVLYLLGNTESFGAHVFSSTVNRWNGMIVRVHPQTGWSCCFTGRTYSFPSVIGLQVGSVGEVNTYKMAIGSGGIVGFRPIRVWNGCD